MLAYKRCLWSMVSWLSIAFIRSQNPHFNVNTISTVIMSKTQDRLNRFYEIDNLITVNITMPPDEWESLMACEPRGGICNFDYVGGPRFDWYKATSVTFSGTKMPQKEARFEDVGLIKKSYCGSFSKTKPSLRLDFGRNLPDNEEAVEKLIGAKSLTLNNCLQDPSFIRQPLGYELFRQAGVPYARCNFATLSVNGRSMGVFVNLEQYKKQFLKNNFGGNDDGNLYELDAGDDLDADLIAKGKISFETGLADDQKDLLVAADAIARRGLAGAQQVLDYEAFLALFAMEVLLKHRDGFTVNTNNTYLYNDVRAVADPTGADDVRLKFIPCGLDQILRPVKDFPLGGQAIVARLIRDAPAARADLLAVLERLAHTLFSRAAYETRLGPYVDRLEALVGQAGAHPQDEMATVRAQLRLVRSGAYQHCGGFPAAPELSFVRRDSTEAFAPASSPDYVPEMTASVFGEWWKTGYWTLKRKASGRYVALGAPGAPSSEVGEVEDRAQATQFYLY